MVETRHALSLQIRVVFTNMRHFYNTPPIYFFDFSSAAFLASSFFWAAFLAFLLK